VAIDALLQGAIARSRLAPESRLDPVVGGRIEQLAMRLHDGVRPGQYVVGVKRLPCTPTVLTKLVTGRIRDFSLKGSNDLDDGLGARPDVFDAPADGLDAWN
jgi:hypothetical protein